MEEIIKFIDNTSLEEKNKKRLIEIFEKNYKRLKKVVGESEALRNIQGSLAEGTIVMSLQKSFAIFFHENKIKDDRLELLIIGDVSLSKYKSRLIEIMQTLKEKGL